MVGAVVRRLAIEDLLRESDAVQKCRHGFELEGCEARLCVEFVEIFQQGYSEGGSNDIASSLVGI